MAADPGSPSLTTLPLVAAAAQQALRDLEHILDAVWGLRIQPGHMRDLSPQELLALLAAQDQDLRTLAAQVAYWHQQPQDAATTDLLATTATTLAAALALLATVRAVIETMDGD